VLIRMQDVNSVKSVIEKINIRYLCNNFNLNEIPYDVMLSEGFQPDLFGPDSNGGMECIFELKSRTYPIRQATKRKRPKTDYEWWRADPRQISDYEQYAGKLESGLFWIFLLAHTNKQLTRTASITERTVRKREIYVVPWEVHLPSPVTDRGCVKNIGLARIKQNYAFTRHAAKKGELFIAENIAEQVNEFFV